MSVALLACVGAFVTLACLVSLNFEVTGFGREADAEPQFLYTVFLVVGAVAGVAVPAVATYFLLGPSGKAVAAIVGVAALLGLIVFMGFGIF